MWLSIAFHRNLHACSMHEDSKHLNLSECITPNITILILPKVEISLPALIMDTI